MGFQEDREQLHNQMHNVRRDIDRERNNAINGRRGAWWCYGEATYKGNSRLYIMGPWGGEREATEQAEHRYSEDFEVLFLPTIDRAAATAMIKKKRMEQLDLSLGEATRYARHHDTDGL